MLAAASLELKAEKQSAHSGFVRSVAFSPNGKTIVSGSDDRTIKVWDAVNFRPFNASEWEEVNISGVPKDRNGYVTIEGLGKTHKESYWRNTVTSHKQEEKPSTGASSIVGVGCGCVSTDTPSKPHYPDLTASVLAAASLELKEEKQNAHARYVRSGPSGCTAVQFSPDGSTIVSCGVDQTLKVWDAGVSALTHPNP